MSRDLSGLSDRIGTLIREVRVQLETRFAEQVTRLEGLIRAVPAGPQGPQGERGLQGERGERGPAGDNGIRGDKGDPGEQGPQGDTGLSITGPQGEQGLQGERGERGADAVLPDLEPMIQRAFESGFVKWAVDMERRSQEVFQRAIDKMPKPKDALEIEDLAITDDGHGSVTFTFKRGELKREFTITIPSMEYFGVWREGQSYKRGNHATWAGSLWHCQAATTNTKPGNGSTDWQLAVKRGEDGRSGKDGERGPQGATGRNGGGF